MNKMKKTLMLVLSLAMSATLVVACNDNNDDNDNTEHSENNEYSDISKIMLARGVAYVDSNREVIERTDWNLLSIDIPQAIDGFNAMVFKPTDDVPTDVEYLRFDVIYKDNETVKTVYILYDFILKEEYLGCHPCINTSSIRFTTKDFMEKIVPALGHDYILVNLTDGNK